MFKKILIALALILIVLAVIISRQPDEFSVTRTAIIDGDAAETFVQVNNLKNWDNWSPWAKLDPDAKSSFEGPEEGEGAKMSWDGNSDVGAGSMTITESRENELIKFRLDFVKPMEGTNISEFKLVPKDDKTEVTWSMSGKSNFISKAIGLVFDCEKMVGKNFEDGLKNLNGVVKANKQRVA